MKGLTMAPSSFSVNSRERSGLIRPFQMPFAISVPLAARPLYWTVLPLQLISANTISTIRVYSHHSFGLVRYLVTMS